METIELDSRSSIVLDDTDSIWIVQAGVVDVYAAVVVHGEISARRVHLFQAEIGQALFGFSAQERQGIALVVCGCAGTKLGRRHLGTLLEQARKAEDRIFVEPLIYFIESWILGLSRAIVQAVAAPQKFALIADGVSMELPAGAIVRPAREIAWVKITSPGSVYYLGETELAFTEQNGYIAIAESHWLTAGQHLQLQSAATETLFDFSADPSSLVVCRGLHSFHHAILGFLGLRLREAQEQERARLERKQEREMSVITQAFASLSQVIDVFGKKKTLADSCDPLLNACQQVATAARIKYKTIDPKLIKGADRIQALQLISQAFQCKFHKVILRDEWWKKDNGPFVAFREDGSPVALIPLSPTRYKVLDGADNVEQVVGEEQGDVLQPEAYMFFRPLPTGVLTWQKLLFFCLGCCWRRDFVVIALLGALTGILGMVTPIATGMLMEDIIPAAQWRDLLMMGVSLLGCAVVSSLLGYVISIAQIRAEGRTSLYLQAAIWDRVLNLPVTFFRRFAVGDLADRMMGINAMRQLLSGTAMTTIEVGIFSTFNLGLLFFYDAKLGGIALAMIVVFFLLAGINAFIIYRFRMEMMQAGGNMLGLLHQIMCGVTKFQMTGTVNRAFALWARQFSVMRAISVKTRIYSFVSLTSSGFQVIMQMVIYYFAATMTIGPAGFIAFNVAFYSYTTAMVGLTGALFSLIDLIPLYVRTKPILNTLPEVTVAKRNPGILTGDIQINHLFFRYHPHTPYVLRDISLTIRKGEFVAIVGPSGSGKSTLLRLLLGFEAVGAGSIRYDGQELHDVNIQFVRNQLGVVLQNGQLMSGDIVTNIMGASNLTLQDAWEAATMAGIDEDIRRMPLGMYTMLGEGGGTISGGQRQRLLIARALIKRPRIIFFDEATSSLDNKAQSIVSSSLEQLKATRVVIAHRLSTIQKADRIFVLDRGRIVETGTYEELMENNNVFATLVRRQLA